MVGGKETVTEPFKLLVGIDWAKESHDVCILDAKRAEVWRGKIKHSGEEIAGLADRLDKLSEGQPGSVGVAIETPRGAVVDTLVERRFAVHSINPKQMDRFRDRHSVAGAKSDRLDAFVLADSLRTDQHLFHHVRPDDARVIRLRELSRTEEDLKQETVRAGHQLRELLVRYFPQMLELCPSVDEAWFWALLERVPMPQNAAKLKPEKVQELLKKHRIRRLTGEDIVKALAVKPLHLAPGAAEAASEHALLQIPRLRLLLQQKGAVAERIQKLLNELGEPDPEQPNEHRDVKIILSLPGLGRITAATMLAEANEAIQKRDYHALRSYGGVAPITRQTGKSKGVVMMRRSCNTRLKDAFYHWGRVSAQHDERSKKQYARLRASGATHGRAVRGVVDRLLGVLVVMLETGTLYDPAFSANTPTKPPA
jgi:transposase